MSTDDPLGGGMRPRRRVAGGPAVRAAFVGPFEPRGWKVAGTLVPFAYIGWSLRLLALGIALLATA